MILAAGCSWTDAQFSTSDQSLKEEDRGPWPMWPEIMGKELNLKVKNVGLSGCDNKYIFDACIDEVWKHTKIDLCVVMWTGWDRFRYLNIQKYPMVTYAMANPVGEDNKTYADQLIVDGKRTEKEVNEFFSQYFLEKDLDEFTPFYNQPNDVLKRYSEDVIDTTFRYMHLLAITLENNNIPYIFVQGIPAFPLGWVSSNYSDEEVLKDMMRCVYMPYLKKNKNIIGFPFQRSFGGTTMFNVVNAAGPNYGVSELDKHPNGKGQNLMAEKLMRHYDLLYR
jgi:hypothetical protein